MEGPALSRFAAARPEGLEPPTNWQERRAQRGTVEGGFGAEQDQNPTEPERSEARNVLNPGTPGGTRTPNLLIRSQMLYPIELRALEH